MIFKLDKKTPYFYSSKNFRLFYRPEEFGGLEVSVSRKFFRLAVQRNKIKRIIKEVFRKESLYLSKGVVIFAVFKPFAELSYDDAKDEIVSAVGCLIGE